MQHIMLRDHFPAGERNEGSWDVHAKKKHMQQSVSRWTVEENKNKENKTTFISFQNYTNRTQEWLKKR